MKNNSFLDLSFPRIWKTISLLLWPAAMAIGIEARDGKLRAHHTVKHFRMFSFKVCHRGQIHLFAPFFTTSQKSKGNPTHELFHTHANYIQCKGGEKESWSLWTVETCTQNMATWQLFGSPHISALPRFYVRIVSQVAACVYSTGISENLGKEK